MKEQLSMGLVIIFSRKIMWRVACPSSVVLIKSACQQFCALSLYLVLFCHFFKYFTHVFYTWFIRVGHHFLHTHTWFFLLVKRANSFTDSVNGFLMQFLFAPSPSTAVLAILFRCYIYILCKSQLMLRPGRLCTFMNLDLQLHYETGGWWVLRGEFRLLMEEELRSQITPKLIT